MKRKNKGDTRMDLPGHNYPFPDPTIPMPKMMKAKLYRKEPRVQEYNIGGEIERVVKFRQVKPTIPTLIPYWQRDENILKNPRKHTSFI